MKSRVVLVVDDTVITRQGTALAIQCLGFETDEAEDGPVALAKVKTTEYAAIIMDYNMPLMNGLECTAKIRELETGTGSRTPIIGMTASEEQDIRQKCIDAGMDDFIEKSCSNTELRETLAKWVRGCTFVK